jgi:5'-methylthioadenosine phosphorylase
MTKKGKKMNRIKIGVIGGSGIYQLDNFKKLREIPVETPFGKPSSDIFEMSLKFSSEIENQNKESENLETLFYFLPRHGVNHAIGPSEINYRANIFAFKKLEVDLIISFSAVGSLQEQLSPGTFVLPDQFLDMTKGKRERSFFTNGVVAHISCADPVDNKLQNLVYEISKKLNLEVSMGGSYVCIEGPQFSSRAESSMYRQLGGNIIGMTNLPEAYLAKEAAIPYASICMVTDYDCIFEHHCTLDEIMQVMKSNYTKAQKLLSNLLPYLQLKSEKNSSREIHEMGIVTDLNKISAENKHMIKTLMGK